VNIVRIDEGIVGITPCEVCQDFARLYSKLIHGLNLLANAIIAVCPTVYWMSQSSGRSWVIMRAKVVVESMLDFPSPYRALEVEFKGA